MSPIGMKLKRQDFPGVPAETVDRILAFQGERHRGSLPARLVFWGSIVVAFGLFGAALLFDWSVWTHGLSLFVITAGAKLSTTMMVRRGHAEMVRIGINCPKCQQPIYRSGVSASEAEEQWRTVMRGYCPRCFEQIGPNVLDGIPAVTPKAVS